MSILVCVNAISYICENNMRNLGLCDDSPRFRMLCDFCLSDDTTLR